MKALRYLLVASVVMLTALPAGAQYTKVNSVAGCTTFGQTERQYQFRSTSTLLPADTKLGLSEGGAFSSSVSTGDPVGSQSSGPRRERPGDWTGPMENPIGDGVWALLLMAAGYLIYRVRTRRREVTA